MVRIEGSDNGASPLLRLGPTGQTEDCPNKSCIGHDENGILRGDSVTQIASESYVVDMVSD